MIRGLYRSAFLAAALISGAPGGAAAQGPPPISLALPVACEFGKDCLVIKYVDTAPGPLMRDYACGKLVGGEDGHNGTDFAVRTIPEMEAGVAVLATAPGTVLRIRDGMEDISIHAIGKESVKGKECGNAVILDHGGGWESQYCHLKKESIAVRPGDKVNTGTPLARIGLSGATEVPHVHYTIRHRGKVVDPFHGVLGGTACGLGPQPLWEASALAQMTYRPALLVNHGIATDIPSAAKARKGDYRNNEYPADAPMLNAWAEFLGLEAGDEIRIRIWGPGDEKPAEHTVVQEKSVAQSFLYFGVKRKRPRWAPGDYRYAVDFLRKTQRKPVILSAEGSFVLR